MSVSNLPLQITSQPTFQGHDVTQLQPVRGAAVYLLRMILHGWPDVEAIAILQQTEITVGECGSARLVVTCLCWKLRLVYFGESSVHIFHILMYWLVTLNLI